MHILFSCFTDFFCGVFTWCTGVHGRAGLSVSIVPVLVTWRMGAAKVRNTRTYLCVHTHEHTHKRTLKRSRIRLEHTHT